MYYMHFVLPSRSRNIGLAETVVATFTAGYVYSSDNAGSLICARVGAYTFLRSGAPAVALYSELRRMNVAASLLASTVFTKHNYIARHRDKR